MPPSSVTEAGDSFTGQVTLQGGLAQVDRYIGISAEESSSRRGPELGSPWDVCRGHWEWLIVGCWEDGWKRKETYDADPWAGALLSVWGRWTGQGRAIEMGEGGSCGQGGLNCFEKHFRGETNR